MKLFLPIWPRFVLEMTVGGIILIALFLSGGLLWSWGWNVQYIEIAVVFAVFFVIFMLLDLPVLILFSPINLMMNDQNEYSIMTIMAVWAFVLLVYNSFLFALFCESLRFYIKRKKGFL